MSRTRSKPNISVPGIGYRTLVLLGPNGWSQKTPLNFTATLTSESMVDEVIPDFYARCKSGEFFMNPMTHTRIRTNIIPTVGSNSYQNGAAWYRQDVCADFCGTAACAAPANRNTIISNLITEVSTKAMARVSSESVNILATLGELRETKELLVKTCITLRHLAKAVEYYTWTMKEILRKKGKKAVLKEAYLRMENAWMQVRMGYRPFAYEAKSVFDACKALKDKPPKRQTFRAKGSINLSNSVPQAVWSSQVGSTVYGSKTYEEQYNVRATVVCKQRYAGFSDTFGVWKIPQAIWELTKLSWAIDYFFNVGDFIAAWTPDTLWTPEGACYVERSLIQQVNQAERVNIGYFPALLGGYKATITRSVKRTPGASLGIVLRPKMNWAKYLDIMAVTRQFVGPRVVDCMKTYQRMKKKR